MVFFNFEEAQESWIMTKTPHEYTWVTYECNTTTDDYNK